MLHLEKVLNIIPKAAFATGLIGSYILFGGLKGHIETTFVFVVGLGFLIGREFYNPE